VASPLAKRHRILIVDDEESILFAFREFLGSLGWSVDSAREREEAEALIAIVPYSLVIADLRLTAVNDTDGLQIVHWIKERRPNAHVIVLTAYGSSTVEREALDLGVSAFLHKPQPLASVAALIARLLEDSP